MRIIAVLFFFVFSLYAADKPNIIVILTDDQGWGDLSSKGNKDLETPYIDSIGADGAVFDNFYVAPVCSPTRAEFLTGRYSFRSGIWSTSEGGERIDLDEVTIADTFKAAGYKTAAFGKWHSGMQYPYHPNGRGFEEFYGFCSGHWGNYYDPILEHNGNIVKGNGFLVDDFTDKAMKYIEKNKDNPFFVYLPYNTPHSPMQVPDRWWNKFKNKELQMKWPASKKGKGEEFAKAALAMCENIDWNVGRLLKKLDDLKIADNTIIMYFSDNGPNSTRWNAGMKGRKGSKDEGGVRSPLVMRWPAKIKKGTFVKEITSGIDLLPSLASMANIPLVSKKKLDGINFAGVITDQKVEWQKDRLIFNWWKHKSSLRSQKFRLDEKGNLYDIENDRGQTTPVNKKFPDVAKSMTASIEDFRKQAREELPPPRSRPFVICHPDFPLTQVPARDGRAHGNIKRSNRFPNCSYFTNWLSSTDKITFDVEVAEAGEFEVEIYYTCPEDSVGSTFELSCGPYKLQSKITEAHDPPLIGAKEDLIKRMESYVKDFRPLKIGKIKMDKGPATVTLKALNVPGKQVMEFRLMMLKRIK